MFDNIDDIKFLRLLLSTNGVPPQVLVSNIELLLSLGGILLVTAAATVTDALIVTHTRESTISKVQNLLGFHRC